MNNQTPIPSRRQTKTYLKELFASRGMSPRTRYGQNFLIDLNLQKVILDAAEIGPGDVVLEVGAGTGGLTLQLAKSADAVITVEIDSGLADLVSEVVFELPNVTLLEGDILKGKNHLNPLVLETIHTHLAKPGLSRLKLVANLPFNVATPIIANFLLTDLPLASMTITIQKELGDRLLARPSTKDYGSLAVWVQSVARVEFIRQLPPNVFWPRPKVTSIILHIVPEAHRRARIHDVPAFHRFVRNLFLHRRKVMRRVLASTYREWMTKTDADRFLTEHDLATDVRAEQLSVEKLIELGNDFEKMLKTETL